ncbi:MAG TPA: hypothetical protein VD837_00335 [Terriglobales bacterium]|nr:hypothetical protein [Terriglobales bacterium]
MRDGFRAVFRQPSIILAEISWRWAFGAAFWALLLLSFMEYFKSLEVSAIDWLMWKTGFPPFMLQALAGTIEGSGFKLLRIAAILLPGCAVLWALAATFGRTATLRALVEPVARPRLRTIFGLSFLRAALTLAGVLSLLGIYFFAARSYVSAPGQLPNAGRAFVILLLGGALATYIWSVASWILALAPAVATIERCDALTAIGRAVGRVGALSGRFMRVGWAFGSLHFLAFVLATGSGMFALGLASLLPGEAVLFVLAMVALAYFAVVDGLYIARLAAYLALLDGLADSRPLQPAFVSPGSQPWGAAGEMPSQL